MINEMDPFIQYAWVSVLVNGSLFQIKGGEKGLHKLIENAKEMNMWWGD